MTAQCLPPDLSGARPARAAGKAAASTGDGAAPLFPRAWLPAPLVSVAIVLSGASTATQLAASLYVLYLYDRVLPQQDLHALLALTALAILLHIVSACLDLARSHLVSRAGLAMTRDLDMRSVEAMTTSGRGPNLETLGDFERINRFLSAAGPAALFDALWLPICIAAMWIAHPLLALFAAASVLLLAAASIRTECWTRQLQTGVSHCRRRRVALATALGANRLPRHHHAEAVLRLKALTRANAHLKAKAADRALAASALCKGLRSALHACGLALGALLVIEDAMTIGALIASSVIMARTFAILDGALAHWHSFVGARESYSRIKAAFLQS